MTAKLPEQSVEYTVDEKAIMYLVELVETFEFENRAAIDTYIAGSKDILSDPYESEGKWYINLTTILVEEW
jgi:hypothetical protein